MLNAECKIEIYLTNKMRAAPKAPLPKGGWQKSLIFDWGIKNREILNTFRFYSVIPPVLLDAKPPPFRQGGALASTIFDSAINNQLSLVVQVLHRMARR